MNRTIKLNGAQEGAALLITIVVLLALTILALASTNANQGQALMVRNSQFRFEAFNASYTEIDAQISAINNRSIQDGVPRYILALIDSNVGAEIVSPGVVSDPESADLPTFQPAKNTYMTQTTGQRYRGICRVFGQQVGSGSEKIKCDELLVLQNSTMNNTRISSAQNQVYEYKTLAE